MIYRPGKSLIPTRMIQTCLRNVDVSDYESMFDHPILLRLMERSQLSFGDRVFPGGRHSRYEHSVVIYHLTAESTPHLLKKGCITKKQSNDVKIASILHDVGHSPFSHTIGNLLGYSINPERPKTHNDRGVELLKSKEKDSSGRTIKDLIKSYGGSFSRILRIVGKKALESAIISHHTLGTDKIGYILSDCLHTGYLIEKPYFLDLFPFIFYRNGEMGVIVKNEINPSEDPIVSQVIRLQKLIQEMYVNVYFNDKVKQFSRFVEKAVELEIDSGKLNPEQVWDMSEDALTYTLKNSSNKNVKQLMDSYSRNDLYDTVIEFKQGNENMQKKYLEYGTLQKNVTKEFSDLIIRKYLNPRNLSSLERKICKELGLSFEDLMVTLSADPKRIMPEDVSIFNNSGRKIGTSFGLCRKHYASLVDNAENFFALRIHSNKKISNIVRDGCDIVIKDVNEDLRKE